MAVGYFVVFGYFGGMHEKICVVAVDAVSYALGQLINDVGKCEYSYHFFWSC